MQFRLVPRLSDRALGVAGVLANWPAVRTKAEGRRHAGSGAALRQDLAAALQQIVLSSESVIKAPGAQKASIGTSMAYVTFLRISAKTTRKAREIVPLLGERGVVRPWLLPP